jgi:CDP-diacylglycerol---glycerol-3-phosphate 3-phosphatidyltransferase
MNLANKLTLSRVVVIPFFLVALLPQSFGLPEFLNPYCRTLALACSWGPRSRTTTTGCSPGGMGGSRTSASCSIRSRTSSSSWRPSSAWSNWSIFPSWMVILILCREFLITGLRTLAISQGKVLSADRWGKNKTIIADDDDHHGAGLYRRARRPAARRATGSR